MSVYFPDKYNLDGKRHSYYHLFPTLCRQQERLPIEEIIEPQFCYTDLDIDKKKNYKFNGYYQSWKYFQGLNPQDYIYLNKQGREKIAMFRERIISLRGNKPTVFLHVRRGDYLQAQHFHNVLGMGYYFQAMEKMSQKHGKLLYIVFSDDIPWCRKHFAKGEITEGILFFPDILSDAEDYIEMFCMAECDHAIIGNSSFSWWGAFLQKNARPLHTVIYPDKWFQSNDIPTQDLPLPQWIPCSASTTVCVAGKYHHKNERSLLYSITNLGWELTDFSRAQVVFSADKYFPPEQHKDKKFVFGPHFCVIPNSDVLALQKSGGIYNNMVYIQPSRACITLWEKDFHCKNLKMKVYPFGVDTEKFNPSFEDIPSKRTNVFLYYKRRDPSELKFLTDFLAEKGITFRQFTYGQYTEKDYIEYLSTCKYGIWLGSHESQGFALQEALAMNVPLLVWSTRYMSQEYPYSAEYKNFSTITTSIPYWENSCGKYFFHKEELEEAWKIFIDNLTLYEPRPYIEKNLSLVPAMKNLYELVRDIKPCLHAEKVSVIIPTYNRYSYLLEAIHSVTRQSHINTEIIVINDGSTQQEYYTELYEHIPPTGILIHMKSNSSAIVGNEGRTAYTRNIGLKIATGQYIAFLDDDDTWMEDKLQEQLSAMKRTGCAMSCTEGLLGTRNTREKVVPYISEYFSDFYTKIGLDSKNLPEIWNLDFLNVHNSCITSSVIIQKEIVDKIGFMPLKRVGEDYEYWLRALTHTDCVYVSTPLIFYDLNHGDGELY